MTRSKKIKSDSEFSSEKIMTKALEEVMHESMLPYSEFVIMDRAIPRVEDGLKPVQRRVLYSMLEVGVLPDRPYKKSASIVGECMGKYHPHGDISIYDTLVRMAQPFNMCEVRSLIAVLFCVSLFKGTLQLILSEFTIKKMSPLSVMVFCSIAGFV